ncbi:MAG: amidohydrolase family protein [Gemmatimonadales bacterium]
MIDVNTFLGASPWRPIAGSEPAALLATMDRLGVSTAWVTHLPSLYWKDPAESHDALYDVARRHPRLRPVPVIHPGLPGWEDDLRRAAAEGAVAVRADPGQLGLAPAGPEVLDLVRACGETDLPILASVRLEDVRGRHPLDLAPELPTWAVRAWARQATRTRLVITHADRGFIEEVHYSLSPEESARCWWDISWIWGPPEDHLAHLLATIGVGRFLFGSGQPLRLAETPIARLDLLDIATTDRHALATGNALTLDRRTPS